MNTVKRVFQIIEEMTYFWKDEMPKCYEALEKEWELLIHMGDKIVDMWKDLGNLHGRTVELDELDEKI